jgi:hypothetical protein
VHVPPVRERRRLFARWRHRARMTPTSIPTRSIYPQLGVLPRHHWCSI